MPAWSGQLEEGEESPEHHASLEAVEEESGSGRDSPRSLFATPQAFVEEGELHGAAVPWLPVTAAKERVGTRAGAGEGIEMMGSTVEMHGLEEEQGGR